MRYSGAYMQTALMYNDNALNDANKGPRLVEHK